MLEINLLPQQEKEKIVSKRISLFSTTLIIPIIIIILLIIGSLFYLMEYLSSNGKSLDSQISSQQPKLGQWATLQNKINEANKVSDLVNQLSQNKADWAAIFDDLAKQTPGKMQITKFAMDPKNKNQITIGGFADSYRTVMLLKEKLDNSDQFKNTSFTTGTISASGAVSFEMTTELKKTKLPAATQGQQEQGTAQ